MKKTPLKRHTELKRGGPIAPKNPDRKAREFVRAYHSEDRVLFVKHGLRCCVPHCYRMPCENAHIETGGMGRKAHYTKVVPMCGYHHREIHQLGRETFETKHGDRGIAFDLDVEAEWTEQMWQACGAEFVEHHRRIQACQENPV